MRALLLFGCFLLACIWLAPVTVGADAGNATERAEMLDTSLQAVEWYTNESVRKALQAESTGDIANARLFGNKAIESDLKAQGLRNETAAAWQAADKPASAQATWHRAADMAKERAAMLGNRIPRLLRQWQAGGADAAAEREYEILYLQAVFLTAEQWALVMKFSQSAADPDQVQAALEQLKILLPALQQDNRIAALASDKRLADSPEHVQEWLQLVSPP
ncbi:MAG TPA: hypothetical protein VLB90_01665 [Pseudomonadales bacterium]|nr:hypothetical protein [Pseudomonadales bacterium]